jgi:hypothetical protein
MTEGEKKSDISSLLSKFDALQVASKDVAEKRPLTDFEQRLMWLLEKMVSQIIKLTDRKDD